MSNSLLTYWDTSIILIHQERTQVVTTLKDGESTKAAHVDQKLEEEVQQLKNTLNAQDDEKKRAGETLKKITSSKSKLIKGRDQLNLTINAMYQENEKATADHARKWTKLGKDADNDAEKIRKKKVEEALKANPTIPDAPLMEDKAPSLATEVEERSDDPLLMNL
ncbi:hypothetical protein AgCh_009942 [Apium graveolens]